VHVTGEHVAEVAALHSEAAISTAVQEIRADLEEENTWLETELMEVKRRDEALMTICQSLLTLLESQRETTNSTQSLLSNHLASIRTTPENHPEENVVVQSGAVEVPEVPAPRTRRIVHRI
jgi:hypothetical protein